MSGMLFWLALAGAEVALVIFVLLLVYWIRNSSAARRDRKAATRLVARVRKGKADREAVITRFLSEQMGLAGAQLQETKTAILRAELRLLQRFADTYGRRVSGTAAQFNIDVEAGFAPYLELRGGGESAKIVEADVDGDELDALRAQNERLSEELSVTMDTMSRMLSEYSTMFAGGSAPAPAVANTESNVAAEADPAEDMDAAEELPAREVAELDTEQLDIAEAGETVAEVDAEMVENPEGHEASQPDDGALDTAETVAEQISAEDPGLEVAAEELVADMVDPDEIDQLIDADPLEQGLDSLFDDDEIAVLDGDEAKDTTAPIEDDDAIAI